MIEILDDFQLPALSLLAIFFPKHGVPCTFHIQISMKMNKKIISATLSVNNAGKAIPRYLYR